MNLHDALLCTARSLAATRALRRSILIKIGQSPDAFCVPDDKVPSNMRRELNLRKADHGRMMESLASDPALRAHMVPWMIDFTGEEAPSGVGYDDQPSAESVHRAAHADFGTLPKDIRAWIAKHGFEISDSGGGRGGWHLGVLCSDDDAQRLCKLAHEELRTHFDAGILTIQLRFWGWRFKDLYTEDAAEAFLAKAAPS